MCSIVGIVTHTRDREANQNQLDTMLRTLVHRGPNEINCYVSDSVYLGNNRLSITHPDAKNTQPSTYKDIVAVFNGEIYDYKELKHALMTQHGMSFETHCDTEVIPKLYAVHGPEFIKKVNGQFAIAIYDKRNQKLFLYRDRLGKKPLYVKHGKGQLYFSSEVIGIRSVVKTELNYDEIYNIVGYWSPRNTIFQDISPVKEGTYLEIDVTTLKTREHTYWQLDQVLNQPKDNSLSVQSSKEIIADALKTSIKTRLNSDVGYGVYLSGGLDSSIITYELSQLNRDFDSYSISFIDSEEHNEHVFQKQVANYFGIDNHTLEVTNDDIYNSFEEFVQKTESLLFRTAPIPVYLLSKMANSYNEKVVFSGEGSDELFFGYDIFREVKYSKLLAGRNRDLQDAFVKKIYPYMLNDKHLKYLRMMLLSQDSENPFASHFLREKNIGNFIPYMNNGNAGLTIKSYLSEQLEGISSDLIRAQYIEYKTLLLNYLLSTQGDLPTMHNSIESRAPFLDYRLIEKVSSIPLTNIFPTFKEKNILKSIYRDKLPQEILRRPKQPYRAPDSAIFYNKHEVLEKIATYKDYGNLSREKVMALTKKVVENPNVSYQESLYFIVIYSLLIIINKNQTNAARDGRPAYNHVIRDY